MTKTVNICDVCSEIFAGGDAPKNNMSQAPNERHSIPIFSNGEENEGLYGYTDKARVTQPSITVSARGTIGYTAIRNTPFVPIVRLITLTPNPELIDINYLYYAVRNYKFDGSGTSIPQLTVPSIKKYSFPLPTMEEQKRIALLLDNLCELIEKRKKQLNKLDKLVKAQFFEMFGVTGKQVPLTEYVWFQEGPGVRSVDFTDKGTILLTGSNINDNTISFGYKSDRHISNELSSGKYAHFMCDKDDILVVSSAIDPDKFDKKVVVVDVNKKYCLNTGIIRFKPNKQYLTLGYFREFLKTDYFKHQVSSEMRGIAQMHFGPSHLKQMFILLPDSIERQIEFEAFVKQTDKSKFAVQKALDEARLLFDSLMQKYFG